MPKRSSESTPEENRPAPPGYVDTHCHLDLEEFVEDLPQVLDRARAAGVTRWINVGFAPERWNSTLALVERHPGMSCMLGLHPGHADEWSDQLLRELRDLARSSGVVAIGEVGLDFFRGETNHEIQTEAFRAQLALARELGVPAVIHMRDAEELILDVLNSESSLPQLVFHSFDGTAALTDWVIAHGAAVGVGGLATRNKSTALRLQLKRIPMEQVLLETDSPYLVPNGFKHRRNTPESIPVIARFVASHFEMDINDVARQTSTNAERLFGYLPAAPAAGEHDGN